MVRNNHERPRHDRRRSAGLTARLVPLLSWAVPLVAPSIMRAQDVALLVELSTPEVEETLPVFATVRLRNTSDRALALPPLDLHGDWLQFEAVAQDGRIVHQAWVKATFMQIGPFRDTLPPGGEWLTAFLVQKHLFDEDGDVAATGVSALTPGAYRLRARYLTWFPHAEPNSVEPRVVESPQVDLRVVPPSQVTRRRYQTMRSILSPLFEMRLASPVRHLLDGVQSEVTRDASNPWLLYLVGYGIPYAGTLTPEQDSAVLALRARLFRLHPGIGARTYLLGDLSIHRKPEALLQELAAEAPEARQLIEQRLRGIQRERRPQ